ncbi:MAG: phosphatase domain-containing protein [Chloroflexota bacterium]
MTKQMLQKIEKVADNSHRTVRRWLYRNTDVTIMPYVGYGYGYHIRLRGRVLENHTVQKSQNDDSAWSNLRNIIRRFNSDELPHVPITISFGGQAQTVITDEEGFFYAEFDIDEPLTGIWHTATLSYDDGRRQASAQAKIMVTPDDAQYAVVSDMDDTVIRSNVPNRIRLVANTLFKNAHTRLPFRGVAEFYRALQAGTTSTTNPIYYVSNSPYNLHDLLQEFFDLKNIPKGPIFLRDFGLTQRYVGASENHKAVQINRLMDLHPELPFILIGDSGEHDPDIYAEIVRQHPGRIAAIYIRDVRPGQEWKVNQRVQQLAEEIREQGVDMLLIPDTLVAAQHAVEQGFISQDAVAHVVQEVKDDAPSNPIEAFMDDMSEQ